jgi:phosphodiesterase/alkaline phosphatase D-like protein
VIAVAVGRFGDVVGRGVVAVLVVVAASLGFAPSAQALTACEAKPASIEHVSVKEVTPAGVTLEAEINPQDSETTYEFVIVWQVRNPPESGEPVPGDPRALGGPIPAGAGNVTVSGVVSGLQPGYTYWYEVVASNLAGKT